MNPTTLLPPINSLPIQNQLLHTDTDNLGIGLGGV
jgi:hypothetical protein